MEELEKKGKETKSKIRQRIYRDARIKQEKGCINI